MRGQFSAPACWGVIAGCGFVFARASSVPPVTDKLPAAQSFSIGNSEGGVFNASRIRGISGLFDGYLCSLR